MILLISSGLISIQYLSILDKTLFEYLQLLTDRSVINGAADARDDASDQRRIDRYRDPNMFSRHLFQPCRNIPLQSGVKRPCRSHLGTDDPKFFIEQLLVGFDDVRKQVEPVALDQKI